MPYALGIDIGAAYTKAAIRPVHGSAAGRSESLLLGARIDAAPTVLQVGVDGSVAIGDSAEDCPADERDRIIRGVLGRVGDDVPYMLGEQVYPAAQLLATMLAWVVDRAVQAVGEEPQHVAIGYPASWRQYKVGILRAAAEQVGLAGSTLLPAVEAAALDYAAERQLAAGDVLALADLGAAGTRAAVLRRQPDGRFELLGRVEQADADPRADLEAAVLDRVRAELGAELAAVDPADPLGWEAGITLRRECAAAAETLAAQPETVISVPLPAGHAQVELSKDELDAPARPAGETAARLLRRAIRGASVHIRQVEAVVLTGGVARSPLIAEAVSTDLRRPAAVSANPRAAIAKGAAVAAAMAINPAVVTVSAQLARRDRSTSLVQRAQQVTMPHRDETMVLMPEYRRERIGTLDDAEDDIPPRPPLDLTPLDLGVDEPGRKHWWQRRSGKGTASALLVLSLALTPAAAAAQHGAASADAPQIIRAIDPMPPTEDDR